MKINDLIDFKDRKWYVLGINDDEVTLLLKNCLSEEDIKELYDDDDFMISGRYVRHQDNIRPYSWEKSYIKNVILKNFKQKLGCIEEIGLLAKSEIEQLDKEIRKNDDWYWLYEKFPSSSNFVYSVYADGTVSYGFANNTGYGVRPVITMKINNLIKTKR